MKHALVFASLLAAGGLNATVAPAPPPALPTRIQFVFTSDAHYGITRAAFRGCAGAPARTVNQALVTRINRLATTTFPRDGGLGSGAAVGAVDFIVEGGDVANRSEVTPDGPVQSASDSWAQFVEDYFGGLKLRDSQGRGAPLYVVPGNHEASNAIGFYRAMSPVTDARALIGIFNRMLMPAEPKTTATFNYATDRVQWSRDAGGVHFMFLSIWPDSAARTWMARDLGRLNPSTPVIVFTHDQPDAEAKHFRNPNPPFDINPTDKFENLLSDQLADGATTAAESTVEQAALEHFLARHPNVTAYFHGNSNWNQFYDWTGPRHSIALHTFRVDSPMKGAVSGQDERRLSYQIATIDPASRTMTVREVLWNAQPDSPSAPLAWGGSTTVALAPRLPSSRVPPASGGIE